MEKIAENDVARRWTSKHTTALVLRILKGDIATPEATRQNGFTAAETEELKSALSPGS